LKRCIQAPPSVAECGGFLITDWLLERDWNARSPKCLTHQFRLAAHVLRDFARCGRSTELSLELSSYVVKPSQAFDDMPRQANGPAVLGNGTANPMPYPPIAIGAESKTSAPIVLVYTFLKTNVAFLHQFQEAHSPSEILPRHRHDQAQVGLNQSLSSSFTSTFAMPQPVGHARPRKAHCVPVAREPNAHPPFLARAGPLPLL
jgi:hypothetical protein